MHSLPLTRALQPLALETEMQGRSILLSVQLGSSFFSPKHTGRLVQQLAARPVSVSVVIPDVPFSLHLQDRGHHYKDASKKALRQSRALCKAAAPLGTAYNWTGAGGATNLQQLRQYKDCLHKWHMIYSGNLFLAGGLFRRDMQDAATGVSEVDALLQQLAAFDALYQLLFWERPGSTGVDVYHHWPERTAHLFTQFWKGKYDYRREQLSVTRLSHQQK